MKKTRSIILISGNGSNLDNIVNKVTAGFIDMDILMVISDNPTANGLKIASGHKIATLVIDTTERFDVKLSKIIDDNSVDLIILAGFMKILPKTITEKYDGMILNIHPSLLPKHKGLNTHNKVIEAGDKYHGASVHYVTSKLDDGPVIIQSKFKIENNDLSLIKEQVHKIEYEIFPIALKWFVEGNISKQNDKFLFNDEVLECPIEHILNH
tara:strand:- start:896 stop:1528 length:633 start_codon:yes stop_codon:yes gene_type:complete